RSLILACAPSFVFHLFFFFQAEDGIRDFHVTGVQTCALPILRRLDGVLYTHDHADQTHGIDDLRTFAMRSRRRVPCWMDAATRRSEERRVGKEGGARGAREQERKG